MTDDISIETVATNWFHAVKCYHENNFRSAMSFLESDHAEAFGLTVDDAREFRRAVQSFDTKWQAAARAYIHGKYTKRKQFVSSGAFLKLGFAPCREHAEVLRYALKFYEEETSYRQNANSSEVTVAGRYGGCSKPMYAVSTVRTPHRVVGFDDNIINDSDKVPSMVELPDDSSAESISRLSGDCSVACSSSQKVGDSIVHGNDYVQALLWELSGDRVDKNALDTMMFFVFAVIPLVVFAQLRALLGLLFPLQGREGDSCKIEDQPDIEAAWRELRANTLLLDDDPRPI